MEFALGVLHWRPGDFWNATFFEISAAYVGHCRSNQVGFYAQTADDGPSGADAVDMMAETESMKRRFPDRPMAKSLRRELAAARGR